MLDFAKVLEAMKESQKRFQNDDLQKLLKLETETKEDRFILFLNILQYFESAKLTKALRVVTWVISSKKILQNINDAINYKGNKTIVAGKLSEIMIMIFNEIKDENSKTEFDYDTLPLILKEEEWVNAFIKVSKVNTNLNNPWEFIGADKTKYTGKWLREIMKYKWDDLLNMLEGCIEEFSDEDKMAIEFVLNEDNNKTIKESVFKNRRNAAISIMKWKLMGENSEFSTFVLSQ